MTENSPEGVPEPECDCEASKPEQPASGASSPTDAERYKQALESIAACSDDSLAVDVAGRVLGYPERKGPSCTVCGKPMTPTWRCVCGSISGCTDPVTSAQELSQAAFKLGYQRGITEAANWIEQQTGPKWYELIHRKTLVTAIRALHPPKS